MNETLNGPWCVMCQHESCQAVWLSSMPNRKTRRTESNSPRIVARRGHGASDAIKAELQRIDELDALRKRKAVGA